MAKSTNELVEKIAPTKKRNKGGIKKAINRTCDFCTDVAKFIFFAAVIGAGYVLATQGSTNMKAIGLILLAGGVVFFADKTFKK